jgi:FkbM family methyltransferase
MTFIDWINETQNRFQNDPFKHALYISSSELYSGIKTRQKILLRKLLKTYHGKRYIQRDIQNYRMYLNLDDPGISSDLLFNGVREEKSSKSYQDKLKVLENHVDNIVVFEIGANIGYYALMPPSILDEQVKVLAVEPHPDNVELLKKNIKLNNYSNQFKIKRCAIGPESGSSELNISRGSNTHSLRGSNSNKTISTPVLTGIDAIKDFGYDISDINVLRMDIEGFESKAIEGMENILDHIDLLHVELHPNILQSEELEYLIELFKVSDLELVSGSHQEKDLKINSFDEISDEDLVELVAMKSKYLI